MTLKDQIKKKLSGLQSRRLTKGYKREAAVLMLIFERLGDPYFLLTLRTEEVETHKGQISFPGGMRHHGEALEKTAVRETFEEVGIASKQIEVLGRFHDYLSVTDFRVTPYAGYINNPFSTKPQVREVAQILHVPFDVFRDPRKLRVERWERRGIQTDVHFYSYDDYEIWGLTARIIKDFITEIDS